MKFFKLLTLVCVLFSMTVVLQSCKKDDKCDAITCENGGTCDDGTCDCPVGYSGTLCEDEDRDQFLGIYNAAETCDDGNTDSYVVTVSASGSDPRTVTVSNLYDIEDDVIATVSGNNITIASQTTVDGDTYTGTGSIAGNILTINFTISGGGDSDTCDVVCTK